MWIFWFGSAKVPLQCIIIGNVDIARLDIFPRVADPKDRFFHCYYASLIKNYATLINHYADIPLIIMQTPRLYDVVLINNYADLTNDYADMTL